MYEGPYGNSKTEKEQLESSLIGKRYKVSYDDFLPSYYPLRDKRIEQKNRYVDEWYNDDLNLFRPDWDTYFFYMLDNYKTIVEYIGNGLYKDLCTGIIIRERNPENYDLSESIEVPLSFSSKLGASDIAKENDFDCLKHSEEDKRIITDSLGIYIDDILSELHGYINTNEKDREKFNIKIRELDKKRINRFFYIPYSALAPVMPNCSLLLNEEVKKLGTIVIYLGDGLYKDLITGYIYQDKKLGKISFEEEYKEKYKKALEYPIYMDPSAREPVTDFKLLDNLEKRDSIFSQVSDIIQTNIVSLREQYQNKYEEALLVEILKKNPLGLLNYLGEKVSSEEEGEKYKKHIK